MSQQELRQHHQTPIIKHQSSNTNHQTPISKRQSSGITRYKNRAEVLKD